jgi:hypothetical protein
MFCSGFTSDLEHIPKFQIAGEGAISMKEFAIHFDRAGIEDLRRRLSDARFPPALSNDNWRLGTDGDYTDRCSKMESFHK